MGWFKDNIEERLNKLEAEMYALKHRKDIGGPCDLPAEGYYDAEIVGVEPPKAALNGDIRVTFRARVDNIGLAFVGMMMSEDMAKAMYAVRDAYIGKRVRLRAKHKAIPSGTAQYDGCKPDATRVIVGWSIVKWGNDNEGC